MIHHSTLKKTVLAALLMGGLHAAQAQSWLPYFGNTHFGYSTGNLNTGRSPSSAKMADLDGDGDLDAVVSQEGFNTGFSGSGTGFAVLLNLGAGYFGAPTHYPSTGTSHEAVVADFTGDNIPDVALVNTGLFSSDSTISVFIGIGNGSFGADTTYTVGFEPTGLTAADLNGDGLMDLAVANHGGTLGGGISILYNTVAGFDTAVTIPLAVEPHQLVAARINSDSLLDLVVAQDNQRLSILVNTGQGFVLDSTYQQQGGNLANDAGAVVAVGDIDQDLDLDVLYSSSGTSDGTSGQIAVRLNDGTGNLQPMQMVTLSYYTSGATSMKLADLNSDGQLDIIVNNGSGRTGDGYQVLLNQGGTFGAPTLRSGGQWTTAVATGDIDLNGTTDILTVDQYSMELTVHRNLGGGLFVTPTLFTAGVPGMAGTMEAGDIDNDGDLDLVSSGDRRFAVSAPVVVFKNNGSGAFGTGVQVAFAGVQAKLRDMDGDTLADLLYIGGTGSTGYNFYTAKNLGNGTFATPVLWNVGACAPEDIDAADMDNDGDLDVVAVSGCTNSVYVCYNNGTGTFGTAVSDTLSTWGGPLALGDFNNDQRLDIAVGANMGFELLLADSAGGFHSALSYTLDQGAWDLLAADLNDDGYLDIASCNYGSNPGDYSMALRLGNGSGGFDSAQVLPAAYSPDLANVSGITCGDIDDDNDLDLMVSNNATNDMSVYLNQGTGQFSAAMRAGLHYGARSPIFADFNGDNHCEVAALVSLPPSGFQSAIVVLEGTATGSRTAGFGLVTTTLATPAELVNNQALLLQAWPNPFSSQTQLSFTLPQPGRTSVMVYNLLGQLVAQPLVEAQLSAGHQSVTLHQGDLAAGTYLVTVTGTSGTQTMKVVIE